MKYTTVQKFWKFLGINQSTENYQPGNVTDGNVETTETVKAAPVTAGNYYLLQKGVNEETLELFAGTTKLTEATDYTFDSDTSKVIINATGASTLTGKSLTTTYEYSGFGNELNYNETVRLLEQAEDRVDSEINAVFADQSETDPAYLKIVNELHPGKGANDNLYSTSYSPLIKLQTTVATDYTTGGNELVLTNASGFPTSGTIYVGGNKLSYTSKSSNTLTIPTGTPSIDSGSIVRGEVVEVSTSPSGIDPTFEILTPEIDYTIDYDTGLIQLMDEYYFQTDTNFTYPGNGITDRFRVTYMHAWHEIGQDAEVPDEIEELVYMIAGRKLAQRTVLKAITGQRDNFNPNSFGFSELDIERIVRRYAIHRTINL